MVKVTGAENVKQVSFRPDMRRILNVIVSWMNDIFPILFQILQGENDKVTAVWPTTIRRIIGEHAITHSAEDKHKYLRKLALKGFSQSSLNAYIPHLRDTISKKVRCGIFGWL